MGESDAKSGQHNPGATVFEVRAKELQEALLEGGEFRRRHLVEVTGYFDH